MSPEAAEGLLLVLGAYIAVGTLFALAFVGLAVQRLDPQARGMPISARALILPGAAALWPWLLWKWWRLQASPVT